MPLNSTSGLIGFRQWIALRIHNMQFWLSRFFRSQGGRSAEWAIGVRFTRIPSVETAFWSGLCKVKTMPRHIPGEILQVIVKLSREGPRQVDIAQITRSHEVPLARSWNGRDILDLLIKGIFPIANGFPYYGATDTCCGWSMLIGFCQVPGTEPI